MGRLLERLRRLLRRPDAAPEPPQRRGGVASPGPPPLPGAGAPVAAPRESASSRATDGHGLRLAVDGGGESLVLTGRRVRVGHARGPADVGLVADVPPIALELEWRSSLRAGGRWWSIPTADAAAASGGTLADGTLLSLAHNAVLRVHAPDPASGALVLVLERAAERDGLRRVLLLPLGPAGRARIGGLRRDHVVVAGLAREVELEAEANRLVLTLGPRADTEEASRRVELALPLAERVDLALEVARGPRPPFALVLTPLGSEGVGG